MTTEEFEEQKNNDTYLVKRISPTPTELRLYLQEVDNHCPLCGKLLQSRSQNKIDEKKFQIAHIYPNSPTKQQYETLMGLERLGNTCEDFENKIALCRDCHASQDFQTTATEYLRLVSIKKEKLKASLLDDITQKLSLENEIEEAINDLSKLSESDLAQLKFDPVELSKKFYPSEHLLETKVTGYVLSYFPAIREIFKNLEGKNNFLFSVLSSQIKACFQKMSTITNNKTIIFEKLVVWIQSKTYNASTEACEAIVSFFVQDCEVFDEIPE